MLSAFLPVTLFPAVYFTAPPRGIDPPRARRIALQEFSKEIIFKRNYHLTFRRDHYIIPIAISIEIPIAHTRVILVTTDIRIVYLKILLRF